MSCTKHHETDVNITSDCMKPTSHINIHKSSLEKKLAKRPWSAHDWTRVPPLTILWQNSNELFFRVFSSWNSNSNSELLNHGCRRGDASFDTRPKVWTVNRCRPRLQLAADRWHNRSQDMTSNKLCRNMSKPSTFLHSKKNIPCITVMFPLTCKLDMTRSDKLQDVACNKCWNTRHFGNCDWFFCYNQRGRDWHHPQVYYGGFSSFAAPCQWTHHRDHHLQVNFRAQRCGGMPAVSIQRGAVEAHELFDAMNLSIHRVETCKNLASSGLSGSFKTPVFSTFVHTLFGTFRAKSSKSCGGHARKRKRPRMGLRMSKEIGSSKLFHSTCFPSWNHFRKSIACSSL